MTDTAHPTPTAHELTLRALAETNPPVHDALAALGPTAAGDPPLGLLGWMDEEDVADLVRAADLAHRHLRNPDWCLAAPNADGLDTVEALADHVREHGAWRTPRAHRRNLAAPSRAYALAKIAGLGSGPGPDYLCDPRPKVYRQPQPRRDIEAAP